MPDLLPKTEYMPTVLVLDSGVGGLSIYQPLRQRLPGLNYIYAFDNGGFPYGNQPDAIVVRRVAQLIESIKQRHGIQLIVVACNTASTLVLPSLRQRFSCPIVGVVPAIKPAAKLTRNGIIGLLATPTTIQRPYINELFQQFAVNCQIKVIGSTELVQLAEAKLRGTRIASSAIEEIVFPWLDSKFSPDTVVLGCTHFSLLKSELGMILPSAVHLVDSIAAVIKRVEVLLSLKHSEQFSRVYQPASKKEKVVYPVYCTQQDQQMRELEVTLMSDPWTLQPTQVLCLE